MSQWLCNPQFMMILEAVLVLSCLFTSSICSPVGFIDGPCDCSPTADIQCRFLKNSDDLQTMLNNARQEVGVARFPGAYVHAVYIYYSNLGGEAPSDMFRNLGIQYIDLVEDNLYDGFIQPSTGQALVGIGRSLKYLRIAKCSGLKLSSWTDMSNLGGLGMISMPENGISEVTNMLFDRSPPNLTFVSMYSNRIVSLGDRAFQNLKQLKELNLADNQLRTITRTMFASPAEHLETLRLEENQLTQLAHNMFNFMPKLKMVNLNSNKLTVLGETTWRLVWSQLTNIYLEGNKWECTCSQMGWKLEMMATQSQIITGKCASPILTENKSLETLTEYDLACDLEGDLS